SDVCSSDLAKERPNWKLSKPSAKSCPGRRPLAVFAGTRCSGNNMLKKLKRQKRKAINIKRKNEKIRTKRHVSNRPIRLNTPLPFCANTKNVKRILKSNIWSVKLDNLKKRTGA